MKKVLIAEDDKPIARALELKLKNSGFEVQVTENGQEAMDKAENENFDIILLDLMMPVKDGFTFLEERKEKGIKTPVIILSNLSQDGDMKKAKELGAADYFVKSNTPLLNIVENIKKIV
ncbi:MAG: response regulator [Patescibacteria group bacterium]|jgi:two-component system copper resistance phosphate regulon response regulator CusR|nr:response regulator [Patescibacteria group bacterium]